MGNLILLGEVTSPDLSPFITALTSSITPAQVLAILASIIGVGMTFFLMWLGVKKGTRIFTDAVKNGRIHG